MVEMKKTSSKVLVLQWGFNIRNVYAAAALKVFFGHKINNETFCILLWTKSAYSYFVYN